MTVIELVIYTTLLSFLMTVFVSYAFSTHMTDLDLMNDLKKEYERLI